MSEITFKCLFVSLASYRYAMYQQCHEYAEFLQQWNIFNSMVKLLNTKIHLFIHKRHVRAFYVAHATLVLGIQQRMLCLHKRLCWWKKIDNQQ